MLDNQLYFNIMENNTCVFSIVFLKLTREADLIRCFYFEKYFKKITFALAYKWWL